MSGRGPRVVLREIIGGEWDLWIDGKVAGVDVLHGDTYVSDRQFVDVLHRARVRDEDVEVVPRDGPVYVKPSKEF